MNSRAGASFQGKWKVTLHGPTGPQETLLDLATVEGVFGRTQSALRQVQTILDLAFGNGSGEITWINKIKLPLPLTVKFAGIVEDQTIGGQVNAVIMGSFPFSVVKA